MIVNEHRHFSSTEFGDSNYPGFSPTLRRLSSLSFVLRHYCQAYWLSKLWRMNLCNQLYEVPSNCRHDMLSIENQADNSAQSSPRSLRTWLACPEYCHFSWTLYLTSYAGKGADGANTGGMLQPWLMHMVEKWAYTPLVYITASSCTQESRQDVSGANGRMVKIT